MIEFRAALERLTRRQNVELIAARLSHAADDEASDRYSRTKIDRYSEEVRQFISALRDVVDKQIRNPSTKMLDWDDPWA